MKTRQRRGKTVQIPEEWVGVYPTKKTLRTRKEKALMKVLERKKRLKEDELFDYEQEEL